jgi:multicomponent Na+:H+ antiporter subunit F
MKTELSWVFVISLMNLSVALILSFIRLAKGPSLPDRVVSLDLIGILSAAVIAVYSVAVKQPQYLDVAITLTLIAFLSTVAFARYVQQTGQNKAKETKQP